MQEIATQIIAALSQHNWLLLTTLIASVLVMLTHLPALNAWIGARSPYVQPLWPVLCAGLAELSTAAATKTAIVSALVNWGLVSLVALAAAYSRYLPHLTPAAPTPPAPAPLSTDELVDAVVKSIDTPGA
jgi:hypothetical protein